MTYKTTDQPSHNGACDYKHRRFSVCRMNDDGTMFICFHSDDIDQCHAYKQFHHPSALNVAVYKRDLVETFVLSN